jgi:hypothetical protein
MKRSPGWLTRNGYRIFEATHIDAQVNRVQERHLIDQWGYTPTEWLKNRMIKKYHGMRMCGFMTGTDNEIKSKAIQTVRLIRRGFLDEEKSGEYDFPLNPVRVMNNSSTTGVCWVDKLTDVRRGYITSYFEDVERRSVEDCSAKWPDLTFY